jgi:hypothetical protein
LIAIPTYFIIISCGYHFPSVPIGIFLISEHLASPRSHLNGFDASFTALLDHGTDTLFVEIKVDGIIFELIDRFGSSELFKFQLIVDADHLPSIPVPRYGSLRPFCIFMLANPKDKQLSVVVDGTATTCLVRGEWD